jgi:hypothetical protein
MDGRESGKRNKERRRWVRGDDVPRHIKSPIGRPREKGERGTEYGR